MTTPAAASAPLMLGVSGCRGIVGASLTPTVVAEFASSFGSWLAERRGTTAGSGRPRVVLASDGRAGYQAIRALATGGLLAAGCDVVDLGVAMTPTAGVMVDHLGADAGVVLTASHNPQQWNGLKFLVRDGGAEAGSASAAAPDAATADALVARYRARGGMKLAGWDGVGSLAHDATSAGVHVGLVLRALDALQEGKRPTITERISSKAFTVVLDSVNGAGRGPGRLLLERLGCQVIALGDEDGGRFWHTPEPTRENLAAVMERVRSAGAAGGFCQDPDADRLALLSEDGSYIGEEYTLALAARAVLELGGGGGGRAASLAANLSTSRMIDDVSARFGGRVVRTAVGEANVVSAMKRERSPIGGEGNGGVIWPAVTYVRDSLGAMGLVLALMAVSGKSLIELAREIPSYAIEKRKVDLASKDAARPAIEAVRRHFGGHAGARIDLQDGVRVDLRTPEGDSWVHVRASNTEPIMRLIAEAPSAAGARSLLDETARAIG